MRIDPGIVCKVSVLTHTSTSFRQKKTRIYTCPPRLQQLPTVAAVRDGNALIAYREDHTEIVTGEGAAWKRSIIGRLPLSGGCAIDKLAT